MAFIATRMHPGRAKKQMWNIFLVLSTWLSIWTLISILLYLKIPVASTKIYAEDGLSLQTALEKSFPHDFLEPYAGYLDIVWRSGGRVAAFFPLQNAAQSIFLFNTFVLSWITLTLYRASSEHIQNRSSRAIFSLSLLFLPIANFESVANTTNLHFFFMAASLPIFLRRFTQKIEAYKFALFVLVSTLSTPLMLFYVPLVIYLRLVNSRSKWYSKLNPTESALLIGLFVQFLFILARAFGDRTSTGTNSLAKAGYLYLDRVVGSTFVPWWGNVSQSTISPVPSILPTSIYLVLRALLTLILLISFALYVLKYRQKSREISVLITGVFISGVFYWFVIGVLFNPEPRYAIFPSFSLILLVFYFYGNLDKTKNSKLRERVIIVLVLLTWIGSWSPSAQRTEGPNWATEFVKAQAKCSVGNDKVRIPIIPEGSGWNVLIRCRKIPTA
jgi:hypothetical protein